MSTAGARHLAESAIWLAIERERVRESGRMRETAEAVESAGKSAPATASLDVRGAKVSTPLSTPLSDPIQELATVPLYEAAAAHDRQPAEEWHRLFVAYWREYGDRE